MPRRSSLGFPLLAFLLMFGGLCESQESGEEAKPPDGPAGDDGSFFALRSCHQLLSGDSGEFFSPDYLCSNPPLWCNWTIQVDPGKRLQLHLEDLTPGDACLFKQDQVYVEEPHRDSGLHEVLTKCWRDARFTSSGHTLSVVLLISGRPNLPYRGLHARYQAFGPPVVYNPQDLSTDRNRKSAAGQVDDREEQLVSTAQSDVLYEDPDEAAAAAAEVEPESEAMQQPTGNQTLQSENGFKSGWFEQQVAEDWIYDLSVSAVPASTQGTSRSGRGAAQTTSGQPEHALPSAAPRAAASELRPTKHTPAETQTSLEAAEDEGGTQAREDRRSDSEETDPEQPQRHLVEPWSEHRGSDNLRSNHSEAPHLPGDHLFEVAVEVNFLQDVEELWDDQARSLLLAVKALISKKLETPHLLPLAHITSKRIKRLSAGALFILWLQVRPGPGRLQMHELVHVALQGLISTNVHVRGKREDGVVSSVSTADVNECGTQLVLCDINADCLNHFGSYSCRCRSGFQDQSRVGSGGTTCVDVKDAGCSSPLSAETKGVYVLFFLLSCLVLLLLVVAGALYHRHHQGAFLVRCHSPPDTNNNRHHHHPGSPEDSELPPPPLPARTYRESWPQVKQRSPDVELPLLRFSPLPLPPAPESHVDPPEDRNM